MRGHTACPAGGFVGISSYQVTAKARRAGTGDGGVVGTYLGPHVVHEGEQRPARDAAPVVQKEALTCKDTSPSVWGQGVAGRILSSRQTDCR